VADAHLSGPHADVSLRELAEAHAEEFACSRVPRWTVVVRDDPQPSDGSAAGSPEKEKSAPVTDDDPHDPA
jgi:hypothetical protein